MSPIQICGGYRHLESHLHVYLSQLNKVWSGVLSIPKQICVPNYQFALQGAMWSCYCATGGICYSKNSVVYNVHIQACIIYILYIYIRIQCTAGTVSWQSVLLQQCLCTVHGLFIWAVLFLCTTVYQQLHCTGKVHLCTMVSTYKMVHCKKRMVLLLCSNIYWISMQSIVHSLILFIASSCHLCAIFDKYSLCYRNLSYNSHVCHCIVVLCTHAEQTLISSARSGAASQVQSSLHPVCTT